MQHLVLKTVEVWFTLWDWGQMQRYISLYYDICYANQYYELRSVSVNG